MDKQQAQNIIRETFESSFDKSRFTEFIKNLLNRIDDSPFTYQGNYIPDSYKQYIKTLERIGKFSDGENSIDILVIILQKETSLERARTMQRNFIAWYLNGSRGGEMKDAALAAFVSPDNEDWRFSLVKMDYKFEQTKSGKMKVKEEFTPARRWSFLVGKNEKSHTAQTRLVNILKNDEQDPTLEEIEKAFDIETVTKEFFLEYRGLFLHTKDELDKVAKNDSKIKADFEAKGVDTVNFVKKLLGQIVFLYFLQKKGWFGVGRDDNWDTGSKHFLRELFEKKHGGYKNFFNDILEPLFYEALRRDRSDDDGYYKLFDCKIPFLNGGLFDPIGSDRGYNWVDTDILLPDELFSNKNETKEGDKGTGILDVFDRYNFTVKEDEPLEKEVAIDPELLGKAYEKFNAIRPDNYAEFKKALKSGKVGEENKFNKKFGVYYTPREIVHYMCQQSLINYLATVLVGEDCNPPVKKEDIESLIHLGEQVSENEATALLKEKLIAEGKQKTTKNKPVLPESIKSNAALIDNKLAEITVCDPAVGSGAFPVGMMSEIVKARNVLSVFLNHKERTAYDFKRRCIEHSLYGVDIDPGAIEIAKLRLWLSLVVDEDNIKNIKPLPNLDYRIMQGNSLISEFMGINFDSDMEKKSDNLLLKNEPDKLVFQFQQKKDEFLNESNVSRKSKLKEDIDDLLVKIFEAKIRNQKADYFNKLKYIENKHSNWSTEKQRNEYIKQDKEKLYKKSGFNLESAEKQLKEFTSGKKIKPFFLWNLYFSEVFHNNGGFDVVIANPPWGIKVNEEQQVKLTLRVNKSLDSSEYFILRSEQLMYPLSILTFIVPKSMIFANNWTTSRKYLLERIIIDVADAGITFENVNLESFVFVVKNTKNTDVVNKVMINKFEPVKKYAPIKVLHRLPYITQNVMCKADSIILADLCPVSKSIIYKIQKSDQFLDSIPREVFRGLYIPDSVKEKILDKGLGLYVNKVPDVGPYTIKRVRNIDLSKIIRTKEQTIKKLNRIRIIVKVLRGKKLTCTFVEREILTTEKLVNLVLKDENYSYFFILGLLNSSLTSFYFAKAVFSDITETSRVMDDCYLSKAPIKKLNSKEQKPFISIVEKILAMTDDEDYLQNQQKQAKVKALEAEIDQLVYKLYDLTPEEIKIVEGSIKNK